MVLKYPQKPRRMNLKPLKNSGFKSRITGTGYHLIRISKKTNQVILFVLIFFLIGDLAFSFIQYYNLPLSGDIDGGVLHNSIIRQIFDDPFGFNAVTTGEKHVNPNRFFSHYLLSIYFQKIPLWLQNFTNPISSVYLSSALIKITVQLVFVFILASFISNSNNPANKNFLLSAVIISPLFQVDGYWSRMGINDKAAAYVFFYALPLVLLLFFFLPLFKRLLYKKKIRPINYIFLIPLIVVLPLSGPLVPAVTVLVTFLVVLKFMVQNRGMEFRQILHGIPAAVYILLIPITLWSLYSLFLGYYYDSNYQSETISLAERFYRLPAGIFSQIFHSLGFPLMLFVIGGNAYLINKSNSPEGKKLIKILLWIGIFALLYILLLPFGGYRPYRPGIIRYDTFMPVTIALIYFFAASAYFLVHYLKGSRKKRYIAGIVLILLVYTFSDTDGIGENTCERNAFEKMAIANDSVVAIPKDCYIMSWENTFDYKLSESRAELIHFWGITKEKKLFYNKQ